MRSFPSLDRLAFPFTEEQRLLRESAATFARERLSPGAAERDRTRSFPAALLRELGEMGLLAMKVSTDDGGSGADNVGYVLAMEAVSEACASTAVILASSNLTAGILARHGTAAQKARWLSPYAKGELGPASFCLTEPGAGSDAAAITTTAVRDGDGWVIDGQKQWITSGAHAGIMVVFAKSDPAAGKRGMSCFVVERGAPGLVVGREEQKMGLRSSGTVPLSFEGCRVGAGALIGEPGQGYAIALGSLASGRVGIAAQSIGIAEAAFAEGVRYASERVAFGQKVASFQASQFAIADSRTDIDGAWLLALRAAALLDRGEAAGLEASMAKVAASEACGRVVDRMLQLHGGYGYSEEYAIERLYRDARVTRIYEGTNEIQRLVMARELVG